MEPHAPSNLSPWPVRLAAFAVLVVIGVGSIWLIDQRAMQRMEELEQEYREEEPEGSGAGLELRVAEWAQSGMMWKIHD